MTTTELLSYHQQLCEKARGIMAEKNHDYAGASGETPFANFEVTEKLDLALTETGLLIRTVDKIQRLKTYVQSGTLKVKTEGPEDAVLDIINYMILLSAYIKQKKEGQQISGPCSFCGSESHWRPDCPDIAKIQNPKKL